MPRRRSINPPLNIYKKIAFSFIILTLVLIGIVFYYATNFAYITVVPKSDVITSEFNIVVTQNPDDIQESRGIFGGTIINQDLSGEGEFSATGVKVVHVNGDGRVTIKNNYSKNQPLVATTRLLTDDGALFRIRDSIVVPAGGSVDVDIYADNQGQPADISAGTRFTIPGLWEGIQDRIYAESLGGITGEEAQKTVLSQGDIDAAVAVLSEKLIREQLSGISDTDTLRVLTKNITEQEVSANVGDEVDTFSLKLSLHISGVLLPHNTITSFARQTLESVVPAGRSLSFVDDGIIFDVSKVDAENQIAQLHGSIEGRSVIRDDSEILDKSKMVGLSEHELIAYLENFDAIESASVSFFPRWIKKVPSLQDHIIVSVKAE